MLNSVWQIHRVGLIDFWFYDEEEFTFSQGRMLLRGANGSGKSVTMQSFIPLLMDGNMRPERIDPFGSKERKMANYLLDEEDDRDERTGYLYMELKRLEAETYITFGIGMRARKNKKMDTWYFYIHDNRRIGKDFSLFRDGKSRMTCTRTELKNRLGEGGSLFDSQREYENCVNQQLFGFRTEGEYQELLNLLIQLRTPKLSKDFKPTVINEILSNSLQTLSDEDLRPMSEAIENMDSIQTNLENLKESIKAGEQIERVYRQYNQELLVCKARWLEKGLSDLKEKERQIADTEKEIAGLKLDIITSQTRYEALTEELQLCEKEKQSLDASDATRLKEREQLLVQEIRQCQTDLKKKREQLEAKEEAERSCLERKRKEEDRVVTCREKISALLVSMEEELESVSFDDGVFFAAELREGLDQEFPFRLHQTELKKYQELVKEGLARIGRMEEADREVNRIEMQLDSTRKQRTGAEREQKQYEEQLAEIKSELIEEIAGWNQQNRELRIDDDTLQKINRLIDQYVHGHVYSSIAAEIEPFRKTADRELSDLLYDWERKRNEAKKQVEAVQQEVEDWEAKTDPEPEREESVQKNRAWLQKNRIPHVPFYQTVDFDEQLSEKQMNRLEEALLQMGILDALVIPTEHRDAVLAEREGMADRYLFGNAAAVKPNLMELLEVDNGESDILFYQRIAGILSGMGWENSVSSLTAGERKDCDVSLEGHLKAHMKTAEGYQEIQNKDGDSYLGTVISSEGNWNLGILEGTITGTREACFIGAKARERFRQKKLEELREQLTQAKEILEVCETDLKSVQDRIKQLEQEYKEFPNGTDLELAAEELYKKEQAYTELDMRVRSLETQYQTAWDIYKERSLQVQESGKKCRLTPPARAVFEAAGEALENYRDLLTEVMASHARYLSAFRNLADVSETLENILYDLDDIRYDIGRLEKQEREKNGEHQSVLEQLAMTGYEEIRERLDHCIRRIRQIPSEKEKETTYIAGNKEKLKQREEALTTQRTEKKEYASYAEYCEEQFSREYSLFYVYDRESLSIYEGNVIPWSRIAAACITAYGKNGRDQRTVLQERLQELYHANKAQLAEYRPSVKHLFTEAYDGTNSLIASLHPGRLELVCDYRGKTIGFIDLLAALKQESGNLMSLLDDKDRELFEDILANTISKKIRSRIALSKRWVERMNTLMESMDTSSGLSLSLRWKNKPAASEEELGTRELVELLSKDVEIMREEDVKKLSEHFRAKIRSARVLSEERGNLLSFHSVMKEILDYRKWFEFRIEFQKTGEKKKELTDRAFFTFSGGEKAMCMYVPLFSAVAAKYDSARKDAPRLLSLDEAFAGVDERNIQDMFRLMVNFEFNFIINSQVLWADYETVPDIMIYQLIRPQNARFVTVIPYRWNGKVRSLVAEKDG